MSNRTHRWKARSIMKQYVPKKSPDTKIISSNCSINLLFEKSDYFNGSRDPYTFIFKPIKGYFPNHKNAEPTSAKTEPIHISSFGSSKMNYMPTSDYSEKNCRVIPPLSSISRTSGFTPPKKLHENEYLEANSVHKLFCLNNNEIRCFIVSPNNMDTSNIIVELSSFKNELRDRDWKSFRMLIAAEGIIYDVDMLRKKPSNEEDHHDYQADAFGGSIHLSIDDEDDEYDDDEEDRLRQAVNASKFRDSRFISNSKPEEKRDSNDSMEKGDVVKAMLKIAKVFDKGIEHAKVIVVNVKEDVEHIINSMEEMD